MRIFALVFVVALAAPAPAPAATGDLAYGDCIANRGAHGCKKARHQSLDLPFDLAVSPDSRSVYVVALESNAITRFERRSNGALAYRGCFANSGAHGCRKPRHDSLYGSSGVAVSPDGKSVYVASTTGVTAFKRSANGALEYRGCIANQGHHACEAAANNSLRRSQDVAVTADGSSLYVASSGAVTSLGRAANGELAYAGCIANRGNYGCQAPLHDSLRFPNDLALSRDGESVYVASLVGSITELERAPSGALTYGDCFANQGARGCELPVHDSLGYARGVAVSRDGRSVYIAAYNASSITLFSREISTP